MIKNFVCEELCRFCQIVEGKYAFGKVDTPILESEKYIAILSLGGFIKGWVLIVPKVHVLSMEKIYCDLDFRNFLNQTIDMLKRTYGKNFIIFEHGANHEGSLVACGTNHAHLHVVPYEKTLYNEIKKDGKMWIECNLDNINEIVQGKEYWFFAENVKNAEKISGYVHIIKNVESQYFRKFLAQREGVLEKFDYKEYTYYDFVQKSYDEIKDRNE